MKTDDESLCKHDPQTPIGLGTSIRLGLIIGLLSLTVGGIGTAIWWASSLTGIVERQSQSITILTDRMRAIDQMTIEVALLKAKGSDPLQQIQSDIRDLRRMLESHLTKDVNLKTP